VALDLPKHTYLIKTFLKQTVVPRHNVVNERTAHGIIDHLKGKM
jgi:DNA-directed RNA polymerase subunit H (RpoH/RPB5)